MSNSSTLSTEKSHNLEKSLNTSDLLSTHTRVPNTKAIPSTNIDQTSPSFGSLIQERQHHVKSWAIPIVNALITIITFFYTVLEQTWSFLLRYSHRKFTQCNPLYFRRSICLAVFIVLSLFFYTFPEVDLWVSQPFYSLSESTFFMKDDAWVQFIYVVFKQMPKFILPIMLLIIVLSFKYQSVKQKRRITVFALIVLLLSPGLLVHTIFKDQWGRARPRNVEFFGGEKTFTPAWVISDQCERNCSFVSGHAAMGFYFMILGWLLKSRRWFYIGVGIGMLVGLTRIIQGGHFLSDTILSGFMVYWSIVVIAWLMNIPSEENASKPEHSPSFQPSTST